MRNTISSFLEHRQFRPSLWPTLGLIALVAATFSLATWQRHRAEEKQELRRQYERAAGEPTLQLAAATAGAAALRFRRVRVTGDFDARAQVLIDNRVYAGQPGYHVVAPLKLSDGGFVLVDRGWVGIGASRSELPPVPPPPGTVSLEGRLNVPPARYLELSSARAPGPVWENLDIARIAAASGLPLMPYILEQTSESHDGLVRDWPAPDFGVEQHRSYMVQWYSLGLLGCVLWLGLNWRARHDGDESAAD